MKVYDKALLEKLALARPRILAMNFENTKILLEQAKAVTASATPLGPAHFGYHGRDTLKVTVHQVGNKTTGEIRGAIQMYWREFGTRGSFRGRSGRKLTARQSKLAHVFAGGGGEPAFYTAHKAMGGIKRMVAFYYGWRSWWGKK